MRSGSRMEESKRLEDFRVDKIWEKYVTEMAPFYFNTLNEMLNALEYNRFSNFGLEEVQILRDLATIFKVAPFEV